MKQETVTFLIGLLVGSLSGVMLGSIVTPYFISDPNYCIKIIEENNCEVMDFQGRRVERFAYQSGWVHFTKEE